MVQDQKSQNWHNESPAFAPHSPLQHPPSMCFLHEEDHAKQILVGGFKLLENPPAPAGAKGVSFRRH